MILDELRNAAMYRSLGPGVAAALDYLASTDFRAVLLGRQELDGQRLFASLARYSTKPASDARWEAHRRYLDVQYVVDGEERIGWTPIAPELPIVEPYSAEKDLIFFDAAGPLVELRPGRFAIFAPHDVHAPGLHVLPKEVCEVFKVVVKVAWPLEGRHSLERE